MAFHIETRELRRVDIIALGGRVDSNTAPQFEQALQEIIDAGRSHIVLDLSQVEYMSSAALRALISAQKQVHTATRRGDIRIANMPERIRQTFDLAGFLELFQVFDNEVDAVGSF